LNLSTGCCAHHDLYSSFVVQRCSSAASFGGRCTRPDNACATSVIETVVFPKTQEARIDETYNAAMLVAVETTVASAVLGVDGTFMAVKMARQMGGTGKCNGTFANCSCLAPAMMSTTAGSDKKTSVSTR